MTKSSRWLVATLLALAMLAAACGTDDGADGSGTPADAGEALADGEALAVNSEDAESLGSAAEATFGWHQHDVLPLGSVGGEPSGEVTSAAFAVPFDVLGSVEAEVGSGLQGAPVLNFEEEAVASGIGQVLAGIAVSGDVADGDEAIVVFKDANARNTGNDSTPVQLVGPFRGLLAPLPLAGLWLALLGIGGYVAIQSGCGRPGSIVGRRLHGLPKTNFWADNFALQVAYSGGRG
ncbi:MAG: hypothetical protein AAF962_03180 [Actinomycetota bacterium]